MYAAYFNLQTFLIWLLLADMLSIIELLNMLWIKLSYSKILWPGQI